MVVVKRIVAGITGAIALIAAPLIHTAFSSASSGAISNDTTGSVSASHDNEGTGMPAPTLAASSETDQSNTNKDLSTTMPTNIITETFNGQTTVTVNGQTTVVPAGGSMSKTITNDNGNTSVQVSSSDVNNAATTVNGQAGSTHTSSSVHVTSHGSNSVNVKSFDKETDTGL